MCPLWGEAEPLRRTTLPHKSNREPNNKNPPRITYQTTQPRSTPTPPTNDNPQAAKWPKCLTTYIHCHFRFHASFILLCLQRTFLSPQVWSKPMRRASVKYTLILINLTTLSEATLVYITRSSQIKVFHFGLMPMFMVEQPIILFNPNRPIGDAVEKVVNLDFLSKLLRDSFPIKGLLLVKTIKVAHPNPAKLMPDEICPPPIMPPLNAIPKLVFNWFTCIRRRKKHIVGDRCWSDAGPPFVDNNGLMP